MSAPAAVTSDAIQAKQLSRAAIEAVQGQLIDFSHRLHTHPEAGLEEVKASAWLAEELRSIRGASVTHGLGSLPTAVRAEAGNGELVVTLCAEYDALPGVGHACGHNIVAAAALGAFTGLASVADDIGLTVRLLGTPAEESVGGKITMLDQGDFDGSHAVMMAHPADIESVGLRALAAQGIAVHYQGRSAHASLEPWLGINAGDALTVAQTAIALARQQLEPGQQIHGHVISAGTASNVIPDSATAHFIVRADSLASLERVTIVLQRCLEAGALASGAELKITPEGEPFASLDSHAGLEDFYSANAAALGRHAAPVGAPGGSTDMGNVSQRFPTIHPMISLGENTPPIHHPDFANRAASLDGDKAVLDGAIALAWTAVDLATNHEIRKELIEGKGCLPSHHGSEPY